MALYEANFIKLNQLVPDLVSCVGAGVSVAIEDCDLHLMVESQARYTFEVRLTYFFADSIVGQVAEPDLLAKVYLDARMVEVAGWRHSRRHHMLRELGLSFQRPLDEYWVRNNMLSKWLDYLLDQGHKFSPESFVSA